MSEQKNTPTPGPWIVEKGEGWKPEYPRQTTIHASWDEPKIPGDPAIGRQVAAMSGVHDRTMQDARLIVSASNAITNAAHRLGLDPLTLAERLEDGGIAELVQAAEKIKDTDQSGISSDRRYDLIVEAQQAAKSAWAELHDENPAAE